MVPSPWPQTALDLTGDAPFKPLECNLRERGRVGARRSVILLRLFLIFQSGCSVETAEVMVT